MSIQGYQNFEHYCDMDQRASWERLERIEYCDQFVPQRKETMMNGLRKLLRKWF